MFEPLVEFLNLKMTIEAYEKFRRRHPDFIFPRDKTDWQGGRGLLSGDPERTARRRSLAEWGYASALHDLGWRVIRGEDQHGELLLKILGVLPADIAPKDGGPV